MKPVSWIADPGLMVQVASQAMVLPVDLQSKVEEHWQQTIRQHPQFFRGPVLSLDSIQRNRDGWALNTRFTDFAHYLYSREHLRWADLYRVRVVFAAALVVTSDRRLLAGVMGEHTARPQWLQSIGGAATWDDVNDGRLNPIRSAGKELFEETGISIEQLSLVRDPEIVGCTVDQNGSVAIAVGYLSERSSKDLLMRIEGTWAERSDHELARVVAVDLGARGVAWLRQDTHRSVRYLERMVQELEDWGM